MTTNIPTLMLFCVNTVQHNVSVVREKTQKPRLYRCEYKYLQVDITLQEHAVKVRYPPGIGRIVVLRYS